MLIDHASLNIYGRKAAVPDIKSTSTRTGKHWFLDATWRLVPWNTQLLRVLLSPWVAVLRMVYFGRFTVICVIFKFTHYLRKKYLKDRSAWNVSYILNLLLNFEWMNWICLRWHMTPKPKYNLYALSKYMQSDSCDISTWTGQQGLHSLQRHRLTGMGIPIINPRPSQIYNGNAYTLKTASL